MNLARVSQNGQITVPIEIRRQLGLKTGDKILFFQNGNGEIVLSNASASALLKAQNAFSGVAGRLGVSDDEDVQALVDSIRYEEKNREWGFLSTQTYFSRPCFSLCRNQQRHWEKLLMNIRWYCVIRIYMNWRRFSEGNHQSHYRMLKFFLLNFNMNLFLQLLMLRNWSVTLQISLFLMLQSCLMLIW